MELKIILKQNVYLKKKGNTENVNQSIRVLFYPRVFAPVLRTAIIFSVPVNMNESLSPPSACKSSEGRE